MVTQQTVAPEVLSMLGIVQAHPTSNAALCHAQLQVDRETVNTQVTLAQAHSYRGIVQGHRIIRYVVPSILDLD